jgi:hypothetical protein
MKITEKIQAKKMVFGMVHVGALPGTPRYQGNLQKVIQTAVQEAKLYQEAGLDGLILENMHDVPYLKRQIGPEITAAMTAVAVAVRKAVELPIGIQILAGANKQALAVALAAQLQFVRCEGFVFAHVADEGLMQSDAGQLLRYRKLLETEDIAIFTDIKKKHSAHNITSDVSLAETAKAAEFFLTDGVIISGSSTGKAVDSRELTTLNQISIPILLGSGLTAQNISQYWNLAQGFIVGSYFKKDGFWQKRIDKQRLQKFMEQVEKLQTIT